MRTPILDDQAVMMLQRDYQTNLPDTFMGDFDLSSEDSEWLLTNKFALLCGVIVDQSVPATRAWQLPKRLRDRIGKQNWTAAWFATHHSELLTAIETKPALHRFPKTMAQNLASLGQTLDREANGDAEKFISTTTYEELEARLTPIHGMGPKKVNALALIIVLDLKQSLTGMDKSKALFDVHLARILGDYLHRPATAVIANVVCQQIDPTMPARAATYLWRLDRQHRTLASIITPTR
ncbi:MAG: hypothetical protein LKG79_08530 [Furfurilactobacillus sp.]|jgi:3-methyladenine DNA glycosylase/8-oxoguanine DNA glycosylase|uniref:HhH-GPD domain-containing protein n=1 Tax=Furfurilactobacillus milii TaxID=2888272 RepID=A0ABT6D996_9LACO|nr:MULTISPECIES: hypothetical protein [Furfurilactobacillus]QLE65917.1 HhH-GPD protein [Furfurilactobacillus rossiae]MCF6160176.1 hypothetical protein [Furfurilactobacillus milii]MCF6162119.1 hypothetical protein [Furfurilactobacillus milii]MCF6420350.1 hypothetical protein [Furfurilactobacillus milii]MCH4012439.1 hypothetical protein [Furfurilactobacillus sp.]